MGKDDAPIYQKPQDEGIVKPTRQSALRNSILNENYGARVNKTGNSPQNRISNAKRSQLLTQGMGNSASQPKFSFNNSQSPLKQDDRQIYKFLNPGETAKNQYISDKARTSLVNRHYR